MKRAVFPWHVWGLAVNAVGTSRIAPRSPYPPVDHPGAYKLDWTHGRTLKEFQIVYTSEGEDAIEIYGSTSFIRAGEDFLLRPREWHRYRPSFEICW